MGEYALGLWGVNPGEGTGRWQKGGSPAEVDTDDGERKPRELPAVPLPEAVLFWGSRESHALQSR